MRNIKLGCAKIILCLTFHSRKGLTGCKINIFGYGRLFLIHKARF